MLPGFSFVATVRGFAGAFADFTRALFFGGMAAARVLCGVNWTDAGDGATGGRNKWRAGEMSGRREGNTHKNYRICVFVAAKAAPPAKTVVALGAGVPSSHPLQRGRQPFHVWEMPRVKMNK
jgi:hypothetical protein